MIWKDTKIKYFNYFPYDCTAVEEYLDQMAMRGWLLQSINRNFFKFKKIEPKKIKYSVDTVSKISAFDFKDSDVAVEYREYCEAAGWTYVCENAKTQIFCTEGENKIIPIHTDAEEKFKEVFKSSLYYVVNQFLTALLCMFSIYSTLFHRYIESLLVSNILIILEMLIIVLLILSIIQITSFVMWAIKARHQSVKNKFMPYNTYKQLRIRNILTSGGILVYIFTLLRGLIFSTTSNWQFVLLLFIILFSVVIMIYVNSVIEKKPFLTKTNEAMIIVGTIVSVVFIFMIIGQVIISSVTTSNRSSVLRQKANLSLTDFGYKENKDADIDLNKSIIAERIEYTNDNNGNYLSYTIFHSKYPWAIELSHNELLESLNKDHGVTVQEKSTNLPKNIKVFSYNYSESFILVSKDQVINIHKPVINISDEEFLDRVYKKLFY